MLSWYMLQNNIVLFVVVFFFLPIRLVTTVNYVKLVQVYEKAFLIFSYSVPENFTYIKRSSVIFFPMPSFI